MRRGWLLLLLLLSAPGCRVLGIWEPECTPGNDATCPGELLCGADGLCGLEGVAPPGDGGVPDDDGGVPPNPNIEVLASGETGVYLLARADDGTLFWATGGDGGCVRRLSPGGTPASVHCEVAGDTIEGLALAETDVAWIRNGADADDALRVKAQTGQVGTVAGTLSVAAEDVGTVVANGPSLLAAASVDGEDFYAWTQAPTDSFGLERITRGVTGLVTTQTTYGVFFTGGRFGGVALTPDDVYFVIDGDIYARVLIRDNHARDDTGSYSAYSDDGDNATYPAGSGFVTTTFADTMYVATRAPNDAGGILSSRGLFPDSFLAVDLIIAQVDPDSVSRYARGLATDGEWLYYTTGGIGDSAAGLFRLSLAADAVPERLATFADEGGAVAVDDAYIYWTAPARGEVLRLPKP